MILLSWKILKVNDHRPDELSYSAKACLIRSWWSSDWRKLWGQPNLISGLHTRKEILRLSQICKTNPRLLPGGWGGEIFLSSKTFQRHHSVLMITISSVWHFEWFMLKCNKSPLCCEVPTNICVLLFAAHRCNLLLRENQTSCFCVTSYLIEIY